MWNNIHDRLLARPVGPAGRGKVPFLGMSAIRIGLGLCSCPLPKRDADLE